MAAVLSSLPQIDRSSLWTKAATAFIVLAGVVHLVVTPIHWAHAPAHGLFFAVVGVLEIAWGVAFWRRPSPALYAVGWVLAGSLVVLWIVTRLWAAPFHGVPEPVDLGGVVCKLAEVLGVVSLVALTVTGASAEAKGNVWRTMAVLLALSVVVGLATYGVGRAVEPLFPALAASHEHAHDAGDAGHSHDTGSSSDQTHEHGDSGHQH